MKKLLALLAITVAAGTAGAQTGDYPTRPIKVIVPFATGGSADMLGRLYGRFLEARLGQPVVVENRPGAGGNIGIGAVASSPADGYTLGLIATGNVAINQFVFKQMPYDPHKDLVPVAALVKTPSLVVVNAEVPARSLAEFIDYARKNPNAISYGSAGQGSTTHLSAAQLALMADLKMIHVPYKGAAPAVVDLVGGSVQLISGPSPNVIGHIRSGKLRALAVASRTRSPQLPDVPTTAEAGLPGYEPSTWYGIVAPTGVPEAVVNQLHKLSRQFIEEPAGRKALEDAYLEPMSMTRAEFTDFILKESAAMEKVVRATGMQAQ